MDIVLHRHSINSENIICSLLALGKSPYIYKYIYAYAAALLPICYINIQRNSFFSMQQTIAYEAKSE